MTGWKEIREKIESLTYKEYREKYEAFYKSKDNNELRDKMSKFISKLLLEIRESKKYSISENELFFFLHLVNMSPKKLIDGVYSDDRLLLIDWFIKNRTRMRARVLLERMKNS